MKKTVLLIILSLLLILSNLGLASCGQQEPADPGDTGDPAESGEPSGNEDGKPVPAGKTFFVSTDGSDDDPGTSEQPLATFSGAVEAVRRFKSENGIPEGGIEVLFSEGRYLIDKQTVFGPEDAGEAGAPVVYRAAEGAKVVFDGGVVIDPSAFGPVSEEVKARLQTEDARKNVLEADLKAAGCYDLADRSDYSNTSNSLVTTGYRQEMYVDNERQSPARWPNSGYAEGGISKADGNISELEIPEGKTDLWADEKIRLCGFPYIEWSANNIQDDIITADRERGVLCWPGLNYSWNNEYDSRYFIYNALCELDAPGEYYWDVEAGKLYYYPDGDLEGKKIAFSQLGDEWFKFSGGSNICFEGFTFENARNSVFASASASKDETRGISVCDCTFRDLGTFAFLMYGYDLTIDNCEFYNVGAGCIYIDSGDAKGYVYGNVLINNCLFHDWQQTYYTYNPAVCTVGYGFTISHNEMYNAPHSAILYQSGESMIEYNYIHDVCLETQDAGAVYAGRRWDWSKTVLRYNFIKDVDTNAFYLDDCLGGQTVYGNLIVNVDGWGIGSSGRYNRFVNNILIDVNQLSTPITIDARGTYGDFCNEHVNYESGDMWRHMRDSDYLSDVMRLAVPTNLLMLEQSGNSVRVDDPGTPAYCTAMNNIVYNHTVSYHKYAVYTFSDAGAESSNVQSNIRYREDPGFTDVDNGDYTLRSDARVFRDIPTFENIDLSTVGRISD